MIAKINSYGLRGINGFNVTVEVDVSSGMPAIDMVGLPDASVKEAKERVRSAIKNSGYSFTSKKITINMAPADVRKGGSMYDLSIAAGILCASNQAEIPVRVDDTILLGELSLNGSLRGINGVLPLIISAKANGCKNIVIPDQNKNEAAYIDGINIFALQNLRQVMEFLCGKLYPKLETQDIETLLLGEGAGEDFKHVKGQLAAKRALEIAAAGGHNVLLIGPPGGGKTMLSKCLPSILPKLTVAEALETTKIHSVAGILDNNDGIIKTRPFRSPHHTSSIAALTGGGPNVKPGEISLAHNGVLFLDELLEYPRASLEILRQPLEDGVITVSRAMKSVAYPADFMLIAGMNPCPCGYYGSDAKECTCTPYQISRYIAKLSGPLMDRIDLHIEVGGVTYDELSTENESEPSSAIRARVNAARKIQLERFKDDGIYSNSRMNSRHMATYCALDSKSSAIIKTAFERLKLSARAYNRILKVSRTIADLDGCSDIQPLHIAEAVGYRTMDRGDR